LLADRIEFDCGAVHDAEHSSVGLSDEWFERDAVDGGDCVVIETFARDCQPKYTPASIRIDSS
jgi:hypothetical protein